MQNQSLHVVMINKSIRLVLMVIIILGCEGEDGALGPQGFSSLLSITSELPGLNCQNGGIRVTSGIDKNSNNILDSDEVTSTAFVCNGVDGISSLSTVVPEPQGNNCSTGGVKINSGPDSNKNGVLDISEIKSTAYACNGVDGKMSLVSIVQEPPSINCQNGGVKISSGVDSNTNGTLDIAEVSVERYICNGKNGVVDEQIRLKMETTEYFGFPSDVYQIVGKGLIDFDIRYYQGVDSVIFTSNLYWSSGPTGAVFVELFNITDNVPIANSELTTTQTFSNRLYIKSPNIYNKLPTKQIELGFRARSEFPNISGSAGIPYLILYRRLSGISG
jgi:hypothetical protein